VISHGKRDGVTGARPGWSRSSCVRTGPWRTPDEGEVLVTVHSAAVTFDALTWPETWAPGGVDRTPIIPSHEFSGIVATAGDGVTGLSIGDEV
jgi:NADPH:quinone reductase-like Zn-dependent oxidoreductase